MGTVYSTLGARLDVVEMMDGLMQGADRALVKIWQKMNAKRFDNILLKTKTVGAEATPEGIKVTFAPAEEGVTVPEPQTYDLVLQAVGRTPNGKKVDTAKFPWAASGRAIANGADYGFTKLIFDAETHRVIGGTIVGPSAGDMIGEVCLAIEMGADATDIGKTIHPHPTLGETVGMAAEVAHGSCTDLPPMRKK